MNPQARRIDAVLMASPAHAMAFYVRPILLAGYERLFFERDANSAEEPALHRSLDLDPALSPQSVAKSLQGDVGFLGSQRFEKLIMRLKFRRRYPPILLAAREPLRSKRCTHGGLAHPIPSRSALRLIPSRTTASIPGSRKSCEYTEAIPAGLRPASSLNQNNPDSRIPAI
jgi:hypothetical protein